ncbi:MAG: peptide chain release factor N(5)-glutamine methyltransferase [Simkaniaceae bacterium]|nr:peptide chain release factor N(5)-glutamine methyltransferase [Simkaniaceae bacterium]
MKTIRDILLLSSKHLSKRGTQHSRRNSELLLSHILKCERMDLYLRFDEPVEEDCLEKMRLYLARIVNNEPVEYVLGSLKFFDIEIKVDSRVLIPRQETEILVSIIDKQIGDAKVLWDVCAGSGCIGLSIKKKWPDLDVSLSDLSKDALDIAKENAAQNGLDVTFYEGDLLTPFIHKKADVVVCNPPYISFNEYALLQESVKQYEPKMALVGGESGLEYYRKLALNLPKHLNRGAKLFFEIGKDQALAVDSVFSENHWKKKICHKDWAGHDRFFSLEFQ